jgi:hypothetical protein
MDGEDEQMLAAQLQHIHDAEAAAAAGTAGATNAGSASGGNHPSNGLPSTGAAAAPSADGRAPAQAQATPVRAADTEGQRVKAAAWHDAVGVVDSPPAHGGAAVHAASGFAHSRAVAESGESARGGADAAASGTREHAHMRVTVVVAASKQPGAPSPPSPASAATQSTDANRAAKGGSAGARRYQPTEIAELPPPERPRGFFGRLFAAMACCGANAVQTA